MQAHSQFDDSYRFGPYLVDAPAGQLRKRGTKIRLAGQPFEILLMLLSRPGQVVTREELLNEVWGYEAYPVSRTVDNHIAGLRAKLEKDPARPVHIRTVHGVGYKFVLL